MIPIVFLAATLASASISAPPNVHIEIVTQVGEVIVTGVPGASVVTVTAAEGVPRPVMTTVNGVVRVSDPKNSDFAGDADGYRYEFRVPAGTSVSLRCGDCTSRISSVASVDVETDSGKAFIDHIERDVTATSLSNNVEISNVGGKVDGASQTAGLTIRNVRGPVVARSVNGTIDLDALPGGAVATNTTGEVHLRGALGQTASYSLETHTGHVRVYLDPGANATIEVNTPQHTLRFREPAIRKSTDYDRRTTLSIGSGTAHISAESFSGAVDVLPSAATDKSQRL